MKIVASISGGLSSAEMLRRLIEQHGRENVIAVFADVKGTGKSHYWSRFPVVDELLHERYGGESRDTYRFLWELSYALDVPIIRLDQHNTVFAHMADAKAFLIRNPGGINFAPCSLNGKREIVATWCEQNLTKGDYAMALGFDIEELARARNALIGGLSDWILISRS